MYERYEVGGQDAGLGKIQAAWFRHMDKEFYAVKFDQGQGDEYFDEEGKSLRKTFLKAPLKFSRISSRFTYSRFHPILKIRRPHTGVDYAAPVGTPVMAVGDGVVIMAKYSGGGGNTVEIRHNSSYTTGYNHLSRYGKGIKAGVYVKQGQVIGYVGTTGLSTGPHLDFRFWKNGQACGPTKNRSAFCRSHQAGKMAGIPGSDGKNGSGSSMLYNWPILRPWRKKKLRATFPDSGLN